MKIVRSLEYSTSKLYRVRIKYALLQVVDIFFEFVDKFGERLLEVVVLHAFGSSEPGFVEELLDS